MWRNLSVVVFILAGCSVGYGQASKSPLSSQGIGDIHDFSLVPHEAMGGIGISSGSYWYLNNINPALLPMNYLTVFEAGFALERRSISSNSLSSMNSGGNLSYLATAFPIERNKWTSSIGIMPYSTVEYEFNSTSTIPGSNAEGVFSTRGTGGINQFYWANGVKIGKSLYLGVRASYLFSSITRENTTSPSDTVDAPITYQANIVDRLSVSDIKFSLGGVYKLDSIFSNKIDMSAGFLFEPGTEISSTRFLEVQRRNLVNVPFETDTLINNESGFIYLPSSLGLGLTFSNRSKWMVGMDVVMQDWNNFKNFSGDNEELSETLQIKLGGEYTPDIASVTSYFNRITYRAGVNYATLPYSVNNNQVSEVGINFGLSLPVGGFSSLDLSMRYGRRGNVAETTIEEEVLRFSLGITFNDQWFIKRKYD